MAQNDGSGEGNRRLAAGEHAVTLIERGVAEGVVLDELEALGQPARGDAVSNHDGGAAALGQRLRHGIGDLRRGAAVDAGAVVVKAGREQLQPRLGRHAAFAPVFARNGGVLGGAILGAAGSLADSFQDLLLGVQPGGAHGMSLRWRLAHHWRNDSGGTSARSRKRVQFASMPGSLPITPSSTKGF